MNLSFSGITNRIRGIFTLSETERNDFSDRIQALTDKRAAIQRVWANRSLTPAQYETLGIDVNVLAFDSSTLRNDLNRKDSTLAKIGRVFLRTFFGKITQYGSFIEDSNRLVQNAENYTRDLPSRNPSRRSSLPAAGNLGHAFNPRSQPGDLLSASQVGGHPLDLDCSTGGIRKLRENSAARPAIVNRLVALRAGAQNYKDFDFAQNEASLKENIRVANAGGGVKKLPGKRTLVNSFRRRSAGLARLQASIAGSGLNLTHDMDPRGDGNCMLSSTGFILAEGLRQGKIQNADLTNLLQKTADLLAHNNMDANPYCTQKFAQGVALLRQLMDNPSSENLTALLNTHTKHQAFLYLMRMMTATAVVDSNYLNSIRQIHSRTYGIPPAEVDGFYALDQAKADHFNTLLNYSENADWESSVAFFDKLNVGFDLFILGGRIGEPNNFLHSNSHNGGGNQIDGVALLRTGGHFHALSA